MSFHRAILVAVATLFTIGTTSIASAGCCGWGNSAPVVYSFGGCGGCGTPTAAVVFAQPVAPAPIAISNPVTSFGGPCCGFSGCGDCGGGCGGCGTVSWGGGSGCGNCGTTNWGNGCGSCQSVSWSSGCGGCGSSGGYASALYVANQGPTYSGPGITVPYSTYSPDSAYTPATNYPYVSGYGEPGYGAPQAYPGYYPHPYYRPRYGYRAAMYTRPHYYGPRPGFYRPAPHWRQYP